MFYLMVGHFHSQVQDEDRLAVQVHFNEHLMQMHPKVRLAGPLKDDAGRWTGHAIIVEADTADEARAFAERSPYHQAHLYERLDFSRIEIVAGNLG